MNEIPQEQPRGIVADILQDIKDVTPEDVGVIAMRENTTPESTSISTSIAGDGDAMAPGGEFDYEGYQVVRREFFAHTNEPSITFNNYKVYFNTACLKKFLEVDYVQALVNIDRKRLAIRPCREEEHDAVPWCVPGSANRKPRQITCKLFFANMFSLMGWNPDYRYKLLGKVVHAKDESLIAFDLSAPEVYQRVSKDGEKPRTSRTPVFPEGWQGQFGLPFKEHQQSMRVDIFDGYAVYAIKENRVVSADESTHEATNHFPERIDSNDIAGGANDG